MTEFKEAEGNLEAFQIAQKDGKPIEGKKKDGTPWQMYKITIGGKTYSGFKKLDEFEVTIGDFVIVTYSEKPNPANANSPYKNIVNIVKGVSKEEVNQADKEYHVEDVEQAPLPQEIAYNFGAFFGMCMNISARFAIAHNGVAGKDKIDDWFDKVYAYAKLKRKQVLEEK